MQLQNMIFGPYYLGLVPGSDWKLYCRLFKQKGCFFLPVWNIGFGLMSKKNKKKTVVIENTDNEHVLL